MNSVRLKNAIIIVLVVVIAVAIIVGSVYVAVDNNRSVESREYFFDTAPIDYSSQSNFAYAKLFKEAVATYFSSVSTSIDLGAFGDRLLAAMSVSRIPAEKLGGMATAIKNNSLSDILGKSWTDMSDEEWEELLRVPGLTAISSFLDAFFEESGLTGEETGEFLYNYMQLYSPADYKAALSLVGEDTFVRFVSTTTYFLTSISDIKQGKGDYIDSAALRAVLFEGGSAYANMGKVGLDNIEKAFGLIWQYGEDKNNAAEINRYTAAMQGKIGGIIPLIGYVLREVKTTDIEAARNYSADGDRVMLVMSQAGFASSVKAGIEKFVAEYGAVFGIDDIDGLKAWLINLTKNLYSAQLLAAGYDPSVLDSDVFLELTDGTEQAYDSFFESVKALTEREMTEEELGTMTESELAEWENTAKGLWSLEAESESFATAVMYMWTTQRIYELEKELG